MCKCIPVTAGGKDGHDRGDSHPKCGMIEGWHFFPVDIQNCIGGRWLVAHGKKGVGQPDAETLDEDELDRRLFTGWCKISITGIRVLRKTWEVSLQAAKITLSFTRGITKKLLTIIVNHNDKRHDGHNDDCRGRNSGSDGRCLFDYRYINHFDVPPTRNHKEKN